VAVGTLVVLEDVNGTPGLPAIDGSRLTGIASGPSAVKSVFTRSGDVVAEAADYSASQIVNDSDTDGLFVSNALSILEHFKSTVFAQVDDPAALSVVGDVWIEI